MTTTQEPEESSNYAEVADAGNLLWRTQKEIDSITRAVNKYRKTCLSVYPIDAVGSHLLSHGSPNKGPQDLGAMESVEVARFLASAGNRWLSTLVCLNESLRTLYHVLEIVTLDVIQEQPLPASRAHEIYMRARSTLEALINPPIERYDVAAWLERRSGAEPGPAPIRGTPLAKAEFSFTVRCVCGEVVHVDTTPVLCRCGATISVSATESNEFYPVCEVPDNYPDSTPYALPAITTFIVKGV